MEAMEMN
jgi:serine/threonine protein phosphatase PrpC